MEFCKGTLAFETVACSRRSDSGERCEVKRSAKKIKAREGERSPQSPSTFYRYLYFAPLSTIWTLGTGYWDCGPNPLMWPFKWKLSTCIYTWCYLFFKISQHEIWKFGRNLLSAKFGSEKCSRPTPQTDHVVLTSKTELDPSLDTWQLCIVRCSYRLKLLTLLIPAVKQIKQQCD